jgi:predicted thioesterase
MYERILPGLLGESLTVVTPDITAKHVGSGSVAVLATPEMVRLMERAGVAAVDHLLPDGHQTVGIGVDVRHLAATPLGMKVRATATLKEIDGRRLTFEVKAWDEVELVGEGIHERMIIDVARFLKRVQQKGEAQ